MDPGPRTLRELVVMAEARRRAEWSRLSVLLATVVRWAGKYTEQDVTADDFNPFVEQRANRNLPYNPAVLQAMQDGEDIPGLDD